MSKKTFTIDFIRHSITEGNLKRWYYGWKDVHLADEGIALLKENREKGVYPSSDGKKLYTSGMIRTEETFELIYGKQQHETMELLKEINFGDFEGTTHDELKDLPVYQAWIADTTNTLAAPGGESRVQFRNRVSKGLELLKSRAEDALVVCHGGVIAVVMGESFGYDPEKGFYSYLPDPGHGYTVRFEYTDDSDAAGGGNGGACGNGAVRAVSYESF